MSEIEALRSQLERLQKLIGEAEQRIATDGKLIEKLQTELTAIKTQASDATEYVLAGINKNLRAENERLMKWFSDNTVALAAHGGGFYRFETTKDSDRKEEQS